MFSAIIFLSGCAELGTKIAGTGEESLTQRTADYFGAEVNEITVADIRKRNDGVGTRYKARYKGQLYDCTLRYWEVECKRPGE